MNNFLQVVHDKPFIIVGPIVHSESITKLKIFECGLIAAADGKVS
jgi:hypothetical protein